MRGVLGKGKLSGAGASARGAQAKLDAEEEQRLQREKEAKRATEVCNFMSGALAKMVTKKKSFSGGTGLSSIGQTMSTQDQTNNNTNTSGDNLISKMSLKLRPITQGAQRQNSLNK